MARSTRALARFKDGRGCLRYDGGVGDGERAVANRMSSIFRGRSGVVLGTLLTVAGVLCMFCGLLLDPSVFLQLTYSIKEPFESVASQTHRITHLTSDMAQEGASPPSKKELGNAGWTLIHSIAANYPEKPSAHDQYHAKAFLRSIGKLYPCKRCRHHFEKYLAATPPDLSSRDQFMLWACGAHNAVNKRSGKPEFPCRMKKLEQRWGDCGCALKKSQKSQ